MLWYGVLILTGLLGQTLQGLAVWLLLALYIIILRQLTRLTRALDNCGYAVEAAPVRLDGRWLAGDIWCWCWAGGAAGPGPGPKASHGL